VREIDRITANEPDKEFTVDEVAKQLRVTPGLYFGSDASAEDVVRSLARHGWITLRGICDSGVSDPDR
jgi:hypothetical protein